MGGLPRQVLPATPRMAAEYAANFGWITASLKGASADALNVNGNPYGNPPQVGMPSVYQGFPITGAEILRWCGSPAGWVAANFRAAYLCDTATPLVDSLAISPNLVDTGGVPTGRECVDLGTTSFNAKLGIEFLEGGGARFKMAAGNEAIFDLTGGAVVSHLLVYRVLGSSTGGYRRMGGKQAAGLNGYEWGNNNGQWWSQIVASIGNALNTGASVQRDGAWHSATMTYDDTAKSHTFESDNDPVGFTGNYAGSASGVHNWGLGPKAGLGSAAGCQYAYVVVADKQITPAMRQAFWRHAQLHAPWLFACASSRSCRMTSDRIANYGSGQVAVGYEPSLVTVPLGNPGGTGIIAEDGLVYLDFGADRLNSWTLAANATKVPTTGPDGLYEAVELTDADATFQGNLQSPLAAIPGADSTKKFRFDFDIAGVGGTTLSMVDFEFSGDPGGPEGLLWWPSALGANWGKRVGTVVVPARPAHDHVQVRVYPTDYWTALTGVVKFAHPTMVYDWHGGAGEGDGPLLWKLPLSGSGANTMPQPITNLANTGTVFNPLRGAIDLVVGGFLGPRDDIPATFIDFNNGVNNNGRILWQVTVAGATQIQMWDSAGALVVNIAGTAPNALRHKMRLVWDSAVPVGQSFGTYYHALLLIDDAVDSGDGAAAWTPALASTMTNLYVGTTATTSAARALIESCEVWS